MSSDSFADNEAADLVDAAATEAAPEQVGRKLHELVGLGRAWHHLSDGERLIRTHVGQRLLDALAAHGADLEAVVAQWRAEAGDRAEGVGGWQRAGVEDADSAGALVERVVVWLEREGTLP